MKLIKRFIILIALVVFFSPQAAKAMICLIQPTQDKVTCEIVLCNEGHFSSRAGCRPALRESINRVIWQGKFYLPLPPECLCSWFPQLLTPTTGDTFPALFGNKLSTPISTEGSLFDYKGLQQTPFKTNAQSKTYRKYAQLSDSILQPSNGLMTSYGDEAKTAPSDSSAASRSQGLTAAQQVQSAMVENNFSTNCTSNSFKRGKSDQCYVRTNEFLTTFKMQRVRSGFRGRTVTYYYDLITNPYAANEPTSHTKLIFGNGELSSCKHYVDGVLTSDGDCNRTSPYPGYIDDEEFFDDTYTIFDDEILDGDTVRQ